MKPVSCSDVDHNLWRYIDRELSAGDLSAISAHLRGCEQCRAQYHEWAREASQYRRVLVEAPFGEAFVSRLRHRMRDEGLFATSRRSPFEAFSFHRRKVRRIATVAAMLILIPIVVVVGFLSNLPGPLELGLFESEGGPVGFLPAGAPSERKTVRQMSRGVYAAGATFVVPRGAVAKLHLGSPSRKEDSILTLTGPAKFAIDPEATKADFRARLSSGVLRADVARRALLEPFAITTEDARVMVLGTEFELSALEARTVLRVWNGIVAFQGLDALPDKAPVDVTHEKGPYVVEKGAMQPVPLLEADAHVDAAPAEKTPVRPEEIHGSGAPTATPPVEETVAQPPRPNAAPEPATKGPAKAVSPGVPDLDTPVER